MPYRVGGGELFQLLSHLSISFWVTQSQCHKCSCLVKYPALVKMQKTVIKPVTKYCHQTGKLLGNVASN